MLRFFWLMMLSNSSIFLLIFCFINCWEKCWKLQVYFFISFFFPSILLNIFIFLFSSSSLGCSSVKPQFAALLFSLYSFRIIISSWLICPIISSLCVSQFMVIFFALKFILCAINIATPIFLWLMCAWYIFFNTFTFSWPVLL